jgi:hypothetical protein
MDYDFTATAWVPFVEGRGFDDMVALGSSWLERQVGDLRQTIIVKTVKSEGAGVACIENFPGTTVTPRSRRQPGPAIVYVPTEDTLALGCQLANRSAICVIETPALPIRGWAVGSRALNLWTTRTNHLPRCLTPQPRSWNASCSTATTAGSRSPTATSPPGSCKSWPTCRPSTSTAWSGTCWPAARPRPPRSSSASWRNGYNAETVPGRPAARPQLTCEDRARAAPTAAGRPRKRSQTGSPRDYPK